MKNLFLILQIFLGLIIISCGTEKTAETSLDLKDAQTRTSPLEFCEQIGISNCEELLSDTLFLDLIAYNELNFIFRYPNPNFEFICEQKSILPNEVFSNFSLSEFDSLYQNEIENIFNYLEEQRSAKKSFAVNEINNYISRESFENALENHLISLDNSLSYDYSEIRNVFANTNQIRIDQMSLVKKIIEEYPNLTSWNIILLTEAF